MRDNLFGHAYSYKYIQPNWKPKKGFSVTLGYSSASPLPFIRVCYTKGDNGLKFDWWKTATANGFMYNITTHESFYCR